LSAQIPDLGTKEQFVLVSAGHNMKSMNISFFNGRFNFRYGIRKIIYCACAKTDKTKQCSCIMIQNYRFFKT